MSTSEIRATAEEARNLDAAGDKAGAYSRYLSTCGSLKKYHDVLRSKYPAGAETLAMREVKKHLGKCSESNVYQNAKTSQ